VRTFEIALAAPKRSEGGRLLEPWKLPSKIIEKQWDCGNSKARLKVTGMSFHSTNANRGNGKRILRSLRNAMSKNSAFLAKFLVRAQNACVLTAPLCFPFSILDPPSSLIAAPLRCALLLKSTPA
jgi:hypothetical protein